MYDEKDTGHDTKIPRKIRELKMFHIHLAYYIIINLALFIFNFFTNYGTWWFLWISIIWGIVIILYYIKFVYNVGKDESKKYKFNKK